MKYVIKGEDWQNRNSDKCKIEYENGKTTFINNSNDKVVFKCAKIIEMKKKQKISCGITVSGKCHNSGGYISINKDHHIPVGSDSVMELVPPVKLKITLTLLANSSVELDDLVFDMDNKVNLVDTIDTKPKVLVIVPSYPSYVNLYSCAFAHSRNREYVKNGLDIQVFVVNIGTWFQIKYERDNIPVLQGSYKDLKELLTKHQYSVVITHFIDEKIYPIFDGNIYNNQKLIFICHGPETVYRYLKNKVRPYFTKPYKEPYQDDDFDLNDFYVKKYSQKDNVEWVFVSDWLKNFSEEEQHLKFKHSRVINNIIDEELFPYHEKTADDRKKILMVRKFDNIRQHSIDQVVFAILELSRRSYFEDLEFDIYGDGNYYDELVAPLRDFKNVHLYRRFIPNEKLGEIYQNHGIMLLPSRHDAHAVSMGESASSGMVVVGSRVTSNPYFMNEEVNHTLADPEDYIELANIVDRLYNNPDEFLQISKNMAEFTRQFNKKNTVFKEIKLIKEALEECKSASTFTIKKATKPILTIGIPAYNVEKYIEKCLVSILNTPNAEKLEVLVINDGSTDNTAAIVNEYVKKSEGVVRLINKENGGHGSTINVAIEEAKGKYFRLVDGDDWVDSQNLAKLIDIMAKSDSDIILTKGSYDYIEEAKLVDIIKYDNLREGNVYNFEDLTYDNFGFKTYGPLLTTGNYKTELLKQTNFKITEKKPYVDMEFNAFSIKYAKTLTYYDLDIYRYLIGREGQTISKDVWKKKYKDHEYIIFNILAKVINDDEYSPRKKVYIYNNIISRMVDSQIFMFDAIEKLDLIDGFLEKLKEYPDAYNYSMKFIKKTDGNSWLILNVYKNWSKNKGPIVIPGVRENMENFKNSSTLKKIIKGVLPYGVIYWHRQKLNK